MGSNHRRVNPIPPNKASQRPICETRSRRSPHPFRPPAQCEFPTRKRACNVSSPHGTSVPPTHASPELDKSESKCTAPTAETPLAGSIW